MTQPAGELSVFTALIPPLRRWRFVAGAAIAFAVPAAIISLLLPPVFQATTTFTSQYQSLGTGSANLASLAGRLGLSVDPGGGNMSPDFLATVLQSREIMQSTVESRYRSSDSADTAASATLLDLWQIEGPNPRRRLAIGIEALKGRITVRVHLPTGIVTLHVREESPALAAAVANRMVELLNEFNLQRRQSQSRQGRRFTEERLGPAEQELRQAEAAHLRFLQANRVFQDAPLLVFEENRLQRNVQLKQEIYLTLNREFEEARIAEVRDTPVLTVIDPAVPPYKRLSPRRRKIVMIAAFLGALAGLMWIYGQAYVRFLEESGRTDFAMLREGARTAARELGSIIRLRRPA